MSMKKDARYIWVTDLMLISNVTAYYFSSFKLHNLNYK